MKNKITTLSKELYFLIISNIKSKKFDEALVLLDKLSDQNSDIVNNFKGLIYINKKNWENRSKWNQNI